MSQNEGSSASIDELKSRLAAAKLKETIDKLRESGEAKANNNIDDEEDDDDGYFGDGEEVYTGVMLGSLKKPTSSLSMRRHYFPSKVGGLPAWLNPKDLPKPETMFCKRCEAPLKFILQIYAPIMDKAEAFHRILYLFCCSSATCLIKHNSIRVLRSQLPIENSFYPDKPAPDASEAIKKVPEYVQLTPEYAPHEEAPLCRVRGVPARYRCSACKLVAYCSKEDQILDWHAAHKAECIAFMEAQKNKADSREEKTEEPEVKSELPFEMEMPSLEELGPGPHSLTEESQAVLLSKLSMKARSTGALNRRRLVAQPMDIQIDEEVLMEDELLKSLEKSHTEALLAEYEAGRKDVDPEVLAKQDDELEKELGEMVGEKPMDSKEIVGPDNDVEDDDEEDKDVTEIDTANVANERERIDPVFVAFQNRVDSNPDQVIRYIPRGLRLKLMQALEENQREADGSVKFESEYGDVLDSRMLAPVWTSKNKRPPKNFKPVCPHCKGPADFEFQVMPQLIYHMEQAAKQLLAHGPSEASKVRLDEELEADDSLDFGTIVVFTCRNSCGGTDGYFDEFVYVQPPHV